MADHRKFEHDYPFLFWLTKVLAGWIPFHLLERSTDRISIGQLIFTDQKYVRLPHTKKPNSVPLYFMGTERVPYNTSVGMEDVAVSDRTMAEMEVSSRLADIFSPKGSIDTTRITDDWLKMLSQTQGNEALANIIAERRNEVVYPENLSTQANTHDIFVELFGENYKEELDRRCYPPAGLSVPGTKFDDIFYESISPADVYTVTQHGHTYTIRPFDPASRVCDMTQRDIDLRPQITCLPTKDVRAAQRSFRFDFSKPFAIRASVSVPELVWPGWTNKHRTVGKFAYGVRPTDGAALPIGMDGQDRVLYADFTRFPKHFNPDW